MIIFLSYNINTSCICVRVYIDTCLKIPDVFTLIDEQHYIAHIIIFVYFIKSLFLGIYIEARDKL